MFNIFKRKTLKNSDILFLDSLNKETFDEKNSTNLYLLANQEIADNSTTFEDCMAARAILNKKIYATRHGVEWFTLACSNYFKSIKVFEEIEEESNVIECFINTYWVLYDNDMSALGPLQELLRKDMSPLVKSYYANEYNIDIFTGMIIDEEKEAQNAYKEHFYKASFVYNQGNGDLALCVKEWRIFLNALHHTLLERPRVIYDFAREVVYNKKLFMFLIYCLKIERIDALRHAELHRADAPLEILLNKMVDAVYAIDEDYGTILKQYNV